MFPLLETFWSCSSRVCVGPAPAVSADRAHQTLPGLYTQPFPSDPSIPKTWMEAGGFMVVSEVNEAAHL